MLSVLVEHMCLRMFVQCRLIGLLMTNLKAGILVDQEAGVIVGVLAELPRSTGQLNVNNLTL
jgi:hypothetical protein